MERRVLGFMPMLDKLLGSLPQRDYVSSPTLVLGAPRQGFFSAHRVCLPFVSSETERRALVKFRLRLALDDHFGLLRLRCVLQSKLRQHQPANREPDAAVQNTKLLRDHTLRHALECLLQLRSRGGNIVRNDHLEILPPTNTSSRVILQ